MLITRLAPSLAVRAVSLKTMKKDLPRLGDARDVQMEVELGAALLE